MEFENPNPIIHEKHNLRELDLKRKERELMENEEDLIDSIEIFDQIKDINDPEHPLTLEQLDIVSPQMISINQNKIEVFFKPTIPHCSVANLIGLMIRVKLNRSLDEKFKITVKVAPGTHVSEESINRQLADKERVAAALENASLSRIINKNIMAFMKSY